MSQFAGLINDLPLDPSDSRFFYAIDFTNVIDDGGSLVNPSISISAEDTSKGLVVSDVSVIDSKVVFRPSIALENQADDRWNKNGERLVVTASVEDGNGRPIQRSGYLWIAHR